MTVLTGELQGGHSWGFVLASATRPVSPYSAESRNEVDHELAS